MEKIYAKLDELGLTEEQLPSELQNVIDGLDERIEALNEEIEELEEQGLSEEEIEEKTGEAEREIDDLENEIVKFIVIHHSNNNQPPTYVQPAQNNPQPQVVNKQPEEKKDSDGWILFGALALVVTLGAVNVFKK